MRPDRILAVDPGLASTGCVLLVAGRIDRVETLRTKADGPVPSIENVLERADELSRDLYDVIEAWQPDVIVAESYGDIPGHLRGARNRWTTPMVIGYLAATALKPYRVVWQDPETVMRRMSGPVAFWERHKTGYCEGDGLLTNEHLRSAAAHALYYRMMEGTR